MCVRIPAGPGKAACLQRCRVPCVTAPCTPNRRWTAGAACVLCRQEMPGLPCAAVPDVRAALGKIACTWYENPAARLTVLGVTGTNGKTTTTYLLRHILRSAGIKTGLIGTVQNLVEEQMLPARRTTPDALEIQSLLRQMADAGCTHAVMEVSSMP